MIYWILFLIRGKQLYVIVCTKAYSWRLGNCEQQSAYQCLVRWLTCPITTAYIYTFYVCPRQNPDRGFNRKLNEGTYFYIMQPEPNTSVRTIHTCIEFRHIAEGLFVFLQFALRRLPTERNYLCLKLQSDLLDFIAHQGKAKIYV